MGSLNFEDLPEAAQKRLLARADDETKATVERALAKPAPQPKAPTLQPNRDRSGGTPAPAPAPRAPQARVTAPPPAAPAHSGVRDFLTGFMGGMNKGYKNKRRPAR